MRRYSHELIERIEHLTWVENKNPREIGELLTLTAGHVKRIQDEFAIVLPVKKQYCLPVCDKWDFRGDNLCAG